MSETPSNTGSKFSTVLDQLLVALESSPLISINGSSITNSVNIDEAKELVSKAYEFAKCSHSAQLRENGEPYFSHLQATAQLASAMQLDPEAIAAALLHDTIEDCGVTHKDLSEIFSPTIADLVEGVSKLTEFEHYSRSVKQAENLRKMLIAAGRDMRVILIKLCDRTHNMRTLGAMPAVKQRRKAQETLDFYAPIAHRLGLLSMRLELEELSFQYLEPEIYQLIRNKLAETALARQEYIEYHENLVRELICHTDREALVTHIERGAAWVWRKMTQKGIKFEDVQDIVSILVVVPTENDCYRSLGEIHSALRPIPFQFNDYVAWPKSNMYRSLHTVVCSNRGDRVSIKIRTHEMHRVVRRGIVEYWYSQSNESKKDFNLCWMQNFLESQKDITNPEEFLDSIRTEIFPFEIVVFTPKGRSVVLPHLATPLDFAYAVSMKVGHHTCGARVNGTEVPLYYRLRNGDTVELITNPNQKPAKEWLDYVKLSKSKRAIQKYLEEEEQRRKYFMGREIVLESLKRLGLTTPELDNSVHLKRVAKQRGFDSISDLYIAISDSLMTPKDLIYELTVNQDSHEFDFEFTDSDDTTISDSNNYISGSYKMVYRESDSVCLLDTISASCCRPLFKEPIVGLVSAAGTITVHSAECKEILLSKIEDQRLVSWVPTNSAFEEIKIKVITNDRMGMLKSVVEAISTSEVSISQANISTSRAGRGEFELDIIVKDYDQFKLMVSSLLHIDGVLEVLRIC